MFGAAWGLATIFAVPLLAVEDAGPIEALRGSADLVRSRWGEGLTGEVGIGLWTFVVALPAIIVLAIGAGTIRAHAAIGIGMVVVAAMALVVISALAIATRQVFALALYRYATGVTAGGFATADLEHPFSARQGDAGARARSPG